jgi:hypothetical protein
MIVDIYPGPVAITKYGADPFFLRFSGIAVQDDFLAPSCGYGPAALSDRARE